YPKKDIMLKSVEMMFSTASFVEKMVESVRFGLINNVCGFFEKNFFHSVTCVTQIKSDVDYA
ncbi:MAG: hypothetical protein J6X60_07615, partial [Ruminiclostridium sp.]|nr:hypothetical protein [Ruminiclostridium sp.]